jgi:hypothetical protein
MSIPLSLLPCARATHSDNWTSEFLPRQRINLSLFYLPLFTLCVLSFIGFCESVSVPGCFLFCHFACWLFLFAIFLFLPFPVETCHCKRIVYGCTRKWGRQKKRMAAQPLSPRSNSGTERAPKCMS